MFCFKEVVRVGKVTAKGSRRSSKSLTTGSGESVTNTLSRQGRELRLSELMCDASDVKAAEQRLEAKGRALGMNLHDLESRMLAKL